MNNTISATEPRLRAAVPGDLAAIERLLVASDLPTEGVREALASFQVAEVGDEIVGVAGLEVCCENALLRSVAVSGEWRSRGVGRALVTRVIADAEARGIHAMYLLTTTAERYFPSFGFRQVTRAEVPADIRETAEFRTICATTSTVMTRVLRSPAS